MKFYGFEKPIENSTTTAKSKEIAKIFGEYGKASDKGSEYWVRKNEETL